MQLCNKDKWHYLFIYLFFYSDSPLDSKIKTNMMCDVFSLSGKYIPVSYTCIIKFEYAENDIEYAENDNNAVRVIPLWLYTIYF